MEPETEAGLKSTRDLFEEDVLRDAVEQHQREVIRYLVENLQFDINAKKTTITEDADRHGLITSRDFGGTKKWRTCYTADATGHTMLFGVLMKL